MCVCLSPIEIVECCTGWTYNNKISRLSRHINERHVILIVPICHFPSAPRVEPEASFYHPCGSPGCGLVYVHRLFNGIAATQDEIARFRLKVSATMTMTTLIIYYNNSRFSKIRLLNCRLKGIKFTSA